MDEFYGQTLKGSMVELSNKTPFAAHYLLLPDTRGVDTLFVNVAARFHIGAQWVLCETPAELLTEDCYWGEPGQSSLRQPLDTHTGKLATDIAIAGNAWAPGAKPVGRIDVSARVGNRQKTVSVFGDRVWDNRRISAPEPFTTKPLRYEGAYGGPGYPANPVGTGYFDDDTDEAVNGSPLPAIECARDLIQNPKDRPAPAGFGFIAPHWYPRADFAGTYDQQWQETRAPYVPLDFNRRFLNAAHPDWIYDGFLQGGEPVELINAHPEGPLRFELPTVKLAARAQFQREVVRELAFNLETAVIDTDDLTLHLCWKASTPCSNAFSRLRNLTVTLRR
ncbi:DUF2169 family type VI secretion system accessory protein [Marinimicrobium alkaliphilum]|uniref:DUF2169 family type VI secretion system accessory protein n=1 Tax=Marinimicrobium alkaliphilum TaxID=2202654 RepID=UPI000DBA8E2D|nr:DUF2169 domain-containing protein [Marinimicrobium alkaliphilum]